MNTTDLTPIDDDNLTRTLRHYADQVDSPDLASAVMRTIRRRNRARAGLTAIPVAGAMALSGWGITALWNGPSTTATPAASPAGALVTTGQCAGLTVTFGSANPGPGQEGRSRPPLNAVGLTTAGSSWTMGRQDYVWIQAVGPCHDEVVVQAFGLVIANDDGDPEPLTSLADDSVGTVFTNSSADGTGSFTIGLDEPCDLTSCHPLATVTVQVRGDGPRPSGSEPTAPPMP